VKKVIFLFCVMIKTVSIFIKNVWICQPQCIYSEAIFQVSTLNGFKVIVQNIHVQFVLCNSIHQSYKWRRCSKKNVVNNVDKSSLWAQRQNGPYKNTQNIHQSYLCSWRTVCLTVWGRKMLVICFTRDRKVLVLVIFNWMTYMYSMANMIYCFEKLLMILYNTIFLKVNPSFKSLSKADYDSIWYDFNC